jgi:hypothetical protein
MSESQWGKGPLFEPPVVRVEAEQQLRVERPPEIDVRQVMAPPLPAPMQAAMQAVQNNPQLAAELWRQVDAGPPPSEQPSEAQTIAQLSLALYLLQTLHVEGKPGYEHLVRDTAAPPDEDDDERDA